MPITDLQPTTDPMPSALHRMSQREQNLLLLGDSQAQFDPNVNRQTQRPGFGQVWASMSHQTIIQGIADAASRPAGDFDRKIEFNPFEHIKKRNLIEDDPRIGFLLERGQFDNSTTIDQFEHDLAIGIRFMDAVDKVQRSTWTQWTVAMAGQMVGDPTNLVPIGAGLNVAKRGITAARTAKLAAGMSAFTLGYKKTLDGLNPAANDPGFADEVFAAGFGASLSALTVGLSSPPVRSVAFSLLDHRKARHFQKQIDRMLKEPMARFREGNDAPPLATGMKSAETRNQPITTQSLDDELASGTQLLNEALAEDVVPGRVVRVLHREGDERDALIGKLRAKYADAGEDLQVKPHADQWFYDLWADAAALLDHPTMLREAAPSDTANGFLDRSTQFVTRNYANAQALVTTGGRLAQTSLARITDAHRTIAGSARTVTHGSQTDPFNFVSSSPAEGIKDIYRGVKDMAIVRIRQLGRAKDMTYAGRSVGGLIHGRTFREAVGDYMRLLDDQARGHKVSIPDDVHPNIKEAADVAQRYLLRMRDELETTEMLRIGPQAIRRAEDEIVDLEDLLGELNSEIQFLGGFQEDKASRFNGTGFSPGAIRDRLNSFRVFLKEQSALAQADDILSVQAGRDDLDINVPEFVGFHPDDLERLTPRQRRRMEQSGRVDEDAAVAARDILGDDLYEKAINELIGGRRTNRNLIDDILERPEQYDTDQVLDAILARRMDEIEGAPPARDLVDPEDIPDDTSFRVLGEDWTLRVDENGDRLIETPEYVLGADELSVVPIDRDSLNGEIAVASKAKKTSTRLKNKQRRIEKTLARKRDGLEALRVKVKQQERYVPAAFDLERVMANPDGFTRRLADEFLDIARERAGGDITAMPLVRELIADGKFDINALRRAGATKAGKLIDEGETADLLDGLTVGDLPDNLQQSYLAELADYYDRNARAVFKKLTDPGDRHGIIEAIDGISNPLKDRVLDIRRSAFAEFLDSDIDNVLERYHRVVGGRTAVARSIQLNSDIWQGQTIKRTVDGRTVREPIKTGDDLKAHMAESINRLKEWSAIADRSLAKGQKPLRPQVDRWQSSVQRDLFGGLDFLMGRNPIKHDPNAFGTIASLGRTALRLSYLNKLGSVFWAQINDLAPVTLYMMQRPNTIRHVAGMFKTMNRMDKLQRRDLEVLGLLIDDITRTRALSDTDQLAHSIQGKGLAGALAGRAERTLSDLSDIHAKVSLMDWITDVNKRVSAGLVMDRVSNNSKRLLRAQELINEGISQGEALRRVGLSKFDAASINRLGFNVERSRRFHRLTYRYGLDVKGNRINGKMSFDDYMKSKDVAVPNFMDWPLADRRNKDLFDFIGANINQEVNRSLVVTPGAFDRPYLNFKLAGRLFNQFQTFGMAFVNQRLRVMAQMPAQYQVWYMMSYLGLGAISDGISNHLSGRRNFGETAQLWAEQPLGMTYAAFERSGLAGWISRPLAWATGMGVPFTPQNLLDQSGSPASRHIQPGNLATYFGPAASDIERLGRVLSDLASGNADRRTAYQAWKLIPFQNLLWFRMLNNATGLPVTPESLIRDQLDERKRREGAKP